MDEKQDAKKSELHCGFQKEHGKEKGEEMAKQEMRRFFPGPEKTTHGDKREKTTSMARPPDQKIMLHQKAKNATASTTLNRFYQETHPNHSVPRSYLGMTTGFVMNLCKNKTESMAYVLSGQNN